MMQDSSASDLVSNEDEAVCTVVHQLYAHMCNMSRLRPSRDVTQQFRKAVVQAIFRLLYT